MHDEGVLRAAAAVALAMAMASPAWAGLSDGKALRVTYLYPDLSTVYAGPVSVTGDAGLSSFAGILNLSFTDTSIRMTLTVNAGVNAVAFDGLRFEDLNQNLGLAGFVLDTSATNYAGFSAAQLSYGPDTLYVNLQGLPGLAGQTIVLGATPPVPEPGTAALLLAGAGLLGWRARRAGRG